jgi:hypothetical protein
MFGGKRTALPATMNANKSKIDKAINRICGCLTLSTTTARRRIKTAIGRKCIRRNSRTLIDANPNTIAVDKILK